MNRASRGGRKGGPGPTYFLRSLFAVKPHTNFGQAPFSQVPPGGGFWSGQCCGTQGLADSFIWFVCGMCSVGPCAWPGNGHRQGSFAWAGPRWDQGRFPLSCQRKSDVDLQALQTVGTVFIPVLPVAYDAKDGKRRRTEVPPPRCPLVPPPRTKCMVYGASPVAFKHSHQPGQSENTAALFCNI